MSGGLGASGFFAGGFNVGKLLVSAVVAGFASAGVAQFAGGGKFKNGAITTAFTSLFSEMAQSGNPEKKGTPGDQSALEQANLIEAQAEFRRLYEAGLLPKKYNFINDREGGLDNEALSFKYVDKAVSGRVAEMGIYDYKGATVYRGGASSLNVALDTVAHEIYHMHPRNQALWKRGDFHREIAQRQATMMGRQTVDIWKENPQ